ncbi:non-ribosomal peptide synthetase [Stappia sp. P2PMeth1]|uniref:non-ribosomal peptide synthetase n=1 Tax=Stappia sp. P2PMeth1 TaxID=2003586 RepID=UPI001644E6B3|nr:non-ribosomal peptide synthetase [Stappia sp. P2PMeth1]
MTDAGLSSTDSPQDTGTAFSAPVSFAQERLWFLDRLQPHSPLYNIPAAWRITGPLDIPALRQALDQTAARHESLRTTFDVEDGKPVQIVADRAGFPLDLVALLPAEEPDNNIRDFVRTEAERVFDLRAGPLARARLGALGSDDHVLVITVHHAVADLQSLDILTRDVSAFYNAALGGRPVDLPELPIQYADYAAWQAERLRAADMQPLVDHWRRYLDGAPHDIALPTEGGRRRRAQSGRGGWIDIDLDPALGAALTTLSASLGATLFMTVSAAFAVLLYRSSGQADFLIGYPVTGRDHPDLSGVVGLFQNTLVLRSRLRPDMPFTDVVRQVREDVFAGQEHRDLPFERLVEELQPERGNERHPLFQTAVTLAGSAGNLALQGLQTAAVTVEGTTSKFDLTLFLSDRPGAALSGGFEYSTDRFGAAATQRLAERFPALLRAIVERPQTAISRLPVIGERESAALSRLSGTVSRQVPQDGAHHLVHRQAERQPDALAVRDAATDLAYGDLASNALHLADRLRQLGVRRGEMVGLCVERSAAMTIGMLGILDAGAAFVPLDSQLPPHRLAGMAADLGLGHVVVAGDVGGRFPAESLTIVPVSPVLAAGDRGRDGPEEVAPVFPAYGIHTSGTSGRPKTVIVPHRGLRQLVDWHRHRYGLGPGHRVAQIASLSFDACTWDVWACLTAGATLVIVDDTTRGDIDRLIGHLSENRVTHAFVPTPLAEAMLAGGQPLPPHLEVMLTGGDRLRRRPDPSHGMTLVNHYGPAECSVVATAGTVGPEGDGAPSIGRPVSGTAVYVLDDHLNHVPLGAPGELCIGGGSLADGYWRQPALTARSFVPDPFSPIPGARMYRTGDLGRLRDDGRIDYAGRRDRQIKLRGQRLEPGEIETVLERLPQVRRCLVDIRETEAGERLLTAYVESSETSGEAIDHWRDHLERWLPAYMVPAALVALEQLPLLPSGKPDYAALPPPRREDLLSGIAHVGPRTPVEETLAAIWEEVLFIDGPGVHDNFFVLGGHSLTVLQVVARIGMAFAVEFTVRDFFEKPTIAEIAEAIEELLWLRGSIPETEGDGGSVVGDL